ncbi:hypothetical protein EII39_07645 [Streptococcus sanguinis]|uniref:Uncharacterized protein n=1 Tax=Streptococcus sanguinis TaxID=1305 RepID=A0A3P1S423_STRSA|nr:hypothetical protein EII39_07645 [Streptococcus sanguinis]
MIYSFSLRFIRVTGLAWPATKKKLFVFTTYLFYQEGLPLSNDSTPSSSYLNCNFFEIAKHKQLFPSKQIKR